MNTQEKQVDSVGYDCKSHEKQETAVKYMMAVYNGVDSMANSDDFLKILHAEDKADYEIRKQTSEFYNVTKGTVDGVVGSVFSDGLVSQDGLSPEVIKLFQDIDNCGNDLESFLRVSFTNAVRDGHSFIFIDAPPKVETDSENATLADVANQKPFWVNYTKSQAKNWQFDVINGRTILTQITFEECVIEKDGTFGEKEVERRRVLRQGSYEIHEKRQVENSKEVKWVMTEDGLTGLEEIPLVVIYTNKKGLLESIPPYLELARTNIKHYNSLSKLDYVLDFIAPKAIIHVDSEDDAKKFKKVNADPSRSLIIWGENADAKYLELQGTSIDSLKQRIDSAEMRMAKMGIEKYAPIQDLSNKTAHEVSSDNQKELSQVALMAQNLEDAVEYALYFTQKQFEAIQGQNALVKFNTKYEDATDGADINFTIAYERLVYSTEQLNFFSNLVNTGKLSLKTFLMWLPNLVDLPNDYSAENEYQFIQSEQTEKAKREQAMMPNNLGLNR